MPEILGVGEVLWDIFPHGKILGGAPANFAFHCRQIGHDALMISRVGSDALGKQLLADLTSRRIPVSLIQRDPVHPTGTVKIEMTGASHSFTITRNVAWDFLESSPILRGRAAEARAICFGSLAQRNDVSRATIRELVSACPGLVVCDINLRGDFYTRDVVENSLRASDVLKLNDEELRALNDLLELGGSDLASIARKLLAEYVLDLVCVTRAERGATLISADRIVEHPGVQSEVVDTVGCGDAFCAVLVDGMLRGKDLCLIGEHANRVGAFVASQPGATPAWPDELRQLVSA